MAPAQKQIIGEIRRLHARRAPLNISAVKRSHPKLIERVYKVRPFWGWKRALEDAGLSYSKINIELRDYVDCKICGRDFALLSFHLTLGHEVTTEDYRLAYPEAEMMCETSRAARSGPRRAILPRWETIWTPEYVLDRMAELHGLRFPLNYGWLNEFEASLARKAIEYFGSWDKALQRIGLDPARIRLAKPSLPGGQQWWYADKAAIVAELRRRKAVGEPVTSGKIIRAPGGPAIYGRARKVFGLWSRALAAADLEPFAGFRSPWRKAKKAAILNEIRRLQRARSLDYGKVGGGKWGHPFQNRVRELFGSWGAALRAADIEPMLERSPWPKADKAAVLAEIRRRQRAGQSLSTAKIWSEKWGPALVLRAKTFFGSWGAALLAAGVEPPPNLMSPWLKASKAVLINEIRRRLRVGKSLRFSRVEKETWGQALLARAKTHFGSWNAALAAAGIELPSRPKSPWTLSAAKRSRSNRQSNPPHPAPKRK